MFALSLRYITACRKLNYTIFKAAFQTLGSRSVNTIRDTMAGIETIPVLYVKGSNNYDIGFTIGKTFKSWIQEHLTLSDDAKRYRDFYATDDGHVIVDTYKANGDKSHPNIMSELRGTADGAEVKFDDLFLLHIASEIDFCHLRERAEAAVDEKANTPKGCTDVLLNRKDCRIIGHNEDWTADVAKRDYLVHATIADENGGIKEQFLSYCYPGNLSGFCFGMNKSLVFSLNSLCPKEANRHSTPLLVCLRSLLGCHTVEECETAMRNEPFGCAYGMNINIASINGNEMCSIEVSPHKGKTQVIRRDVSQDITPGNDCYYYHTNIYRFSEVNQSTDGMGSRLREDRIAEMTSPKNSQDVRSILGDTANEKHPIHLQPNPKHIRPNLKTSATAIFDINEKMLHVYKGNPKTSTMPTLSIPFFGQ